MSSEHCQDCQRQYTQHDVIPVIISCCKNIICRACAFKNWVHKRRRCWYPECSNTNILTLRCAGAFIPPYTDVGHLDEGEDGIVMISSKDLTQKQRINNNVKNIENEGSVDQQCNYSKCKRKKLKPKLKEKWFIRVSGQWVSEHTQPPYWKKQILQKHIASNNTNP